MEILGAYDSLGLGIIIFFFPLIFQAERREYDE